MLDALLEAKRRAQDLMDQEDLARTKAAALVNRIADIEEELTDPNRTLVRIGGLDPLEQRRTALRDDLADTMRQADDLARQRRVTNQQLTTLLRYGVADGPFGGELREVKQPGMRWVVQEDGSLKAEKTGVPFMTRFKRMLTLRGETLLDQVRGQRLTPLLRPEIRAELDVVHALLAEPEINLDEVDKALGIARERILRAADAGSMDDKITRYALRLVDDYRAEARLRADPQTVAAPAVAPSNRERLLAALHQGATAATAMSSRDEGRFGMDIVETSDGTRYLRFWRKVDVVKFEESRLAAIRAAFKLEDVSDLVIEHEFGKLGEVGGGVSVGYRVKGSDTPGHQFEQKVDQGDSIAVKLGGGPGRSVVVEHWDNWPANEKQQDPLEFDANKNVKYLNRITLKNDIEASPALFIPGMKAIELPLHAKVSLELTWQHKEGEAWSPLLRPDLKLTVEFVAGATTVGDTIKALLKSAARSAHVALPPVLLDLPESSSEGAFVVGPWDVYTLPGEVGDRVRQLARSVLRQQGIETDDQLNIVSADPHALPPPGP
jgi:hypothetical protein